jgi:nitroreductase
MPPDSAIDSHATSPAAALAERYGAPSAPPATWNAVLDSLLAHRSVRAYLPRALAPGTVDLLVAAAQSASSSSNLQVWSVVVIEDPARKARLAALAGGQRHIEEAPLRLVWLADLSRAERIGQAAGQAMEGLAFTESYITAIVDAALAAQNAVVAAESLGLGTCYIGAMRNKPEEVAAELALPPKVMAAFGLCVGHPDPARPALVKPRLPPEVVAHREQYATAAEAVGLAAYDERLLRFQEAEGMKPVGWRRSVVSRLRDGGSLMGRDRIREALRNLGFELR